MAVEVNKRDIDTKFITLFADSRPDVDVTFKDPVLTKSTNQYLVGVDNMTVCSTALSMIDEVVAHNHTDLIRIVRKPNVVVPHANNSGLATYNNANAGNPTGDDTLEENVEDNGYLYTHLRTGLEDAGISSAVQLSSVAHLMERLQTIAQIANAAMSKNLLNDVTLNGVPLGLRGYTSPADEIAAANPDPHVTFRLNRSGRLVIEGTKAFWSVCAIEIPNTQYQYGFYGAPADGKGPFYQYHKRRFLTVDPNAETSSTSNMVAKRDGTPSDSDSLASAVSAAACNLTSGTQPKVLVVQTVHHGVNPNNYATVLQGAVDVNVYPNVNGAAQSFYVGVAGHTASKALVAVYLEENLYMGLDRRVGIELGTSLPIKNSPIVDHQKEYPDYILGRWMYRTDNQYVINDKGQNSTYGTDAGAAREYQGARDRVTYHELMPQNKLQVLRTKIFARVRTFTGTRKCTPCGRLNSPQTPWIGGTRDCISSPRVSKEHGS